MTKWLGYLYPSSMLLVSWSIIVSCYVSSQTRAAGSGPDSWTNEAWSWNFCCHTGPTSLRIARKGSLYGWSRNSLENDWSFKTLQDYCRCLTWLFVRTISGQHYCLPKSYSWNHLHCCSLARDLGCNLALSLWNHAFQVSIWPICFQCEWTCRASQLLLRTCVQTSLRK